MFKEITLNEIKAYAIAHPDRETCGYITANNEVIQAMNLAMNDREAFALDVPTTSIAVWHSHVNGNNDFSIDDIKAAKSFGMPWILYHLPTNHFRIYDPNTIEPYIDRPWSWVYRNCFTLFQDWYKKELAIEIPDFYLSSHTAWESEDVGYTENFPKQGFARLPESEPLKKHDVILMSIGKTRAPNHVAIVVDPDGKILHHLAERLSTIDVYGGLWQKSTHSVWRHCDR